MHVLFTPKLNSAALLPQSNSQKYFGKQVLIYSLE